MTISSKLEHKILSNEETRTIKVRNTARGSVNRKARDPLLPGVKLISYVHGNDKLVEV